MNYLADLEAELAEFEGSIELKGNMLRKAISTKERGIELLKKGMKLDPLGQPQSQYIKLSLLDINMPIVACSKAFTNLRRMMSS